MKVLITGGAGYIGSMLVPAMLEAGHHVTVLDNFMHGENSLAASCMNKNLEIVNGDCRDGLIIEPLVKGADVIIPLAAIVGMPACKADAAAAMGINVGGVTNVCRFASRDQRIIYPNSNSGYGSSKEICTEETPMKPISLYGETKQRAENHVMLRENSVAFRLATVFGASPRMRMDLLVNDFVYRAMRDKTITLFEPKVMRNYIHIRNIVTAFMDVMIRFDQYKGRVYNLGDSRINMSKIDLCQKISVHVPDFSYQQALCGSDPDKRDYVVSNDRIEKMGWMPSYTLDEGIVELIKMYKTLRPMRYVNA